MRVIREIEIDDFSEVLNLIENLNQGFQGNSSILIAMIQAAAQQWGETEEDFPPPFGKRNSSSPIDIPPELRDELVELSQLLTRELRTKLIQILAQNQNKSTPTQYLHKQQFILKVQGKYRN